MVEARRRSLAVVFACLGVINIFINLIIFIAVIISRLLFFLVIFHRTRAQDFVNDCIVIERHPA